MSVSSPSQKPSYVDTHFATFIQRNRFANLDGLRFISIFAVLWHHSGISFDSPLSERGQLGVQLFFAISGFLITSLMIRERAERGRISLRNFYVRRSLRIFPLYYAVLLAYIVVVSVIENGSDDGREFFNNLLAYATYTSNWFVEQKPGERVIFFFAWSLATEEQFYLTWPFLEKYLPPAVKIWVLVGIICLVFIVHSGGLLWLVSGDSFTHVVLWSIAPPILLGVLSAHAMHHKRSHNILRKLLGHFWAAPLSLIALLVLASMPRGSQAWEWVIYLNMTVLVVACTIEERNNGLSKLLQFKPIVRLGIVSYGVYLMHMLCFNAVRRLAGALEIQNDWLIWGSGVLIVYLVSELSFRTFEAFFVGLKSRFHASR